jgi:hypothetical protein
VLLGEGCEARDLDATMAGLPVVGIKATNKLVDPKVPSNGLMAR